VTEWRTEPDHHTLAGIEEVPNALDRELATFMSGEDPATFNRFAASISIF
jgi:hypothetical protein